jgi:hypothetical protein
MASPISCVLKGLNGQNGVRIIADFRNMKKMLLGDAYPLSDTSKLIKKLGQTRYIGMFDAQFSYHQR